MRKSRRLAMAAAALTTAAAIGVISPGRASAASWYHMCVENPAGAYYCAYAQGSGYVVGMYQPYAGETDMTNWYVNGNGEIQQANTDLCMEINHDGGNVIREAPCEAVPYQQWTDWYNGRNWFESAWVYGGANYNLTYNQDNSDLDVIPFNPQGIPWYELFELTTSLP